MTDELGTCNFCNDVITEEDRFCPTCGREASHALAGATQQYADLPDVSVTGPAPDLLPAPVDRVAGVVLGLAGAVLIAAAFLPWVKNTLGDTLNGLEYEWAGLPVIVAGFCLGVLGIWSAVKPRSQRLFMAALIISIIAGVFGVICTVGTRYFLAQRANMFLPESYADFIVMGAGIYTVMAGAVLGVAASIWGALRQREP